MKEIEILSKETDPSYIEVTLVVRLHVESLQEALNDTATYNSDAAERYYDKLGSRISDAIRHHK